MAGMDYRPSQVLILILDASHSGLPWDLMAPIQAVGQLFLSTSLRNNYEFRFAYRRRLVSDDKKVRV
jgi:hypothetical protein